MCVWYKENRNNETPPLARQIIETSAREGVKKEIERTKPSNQLRHRKIKCFQPTPRTGLLISDHLPTTVSVITISAGVSVTRRRALAIAGRVSITIVISATVITAVIATVPVVAARSITVDATVAIVIPVVTTVVTVVTAIVTAVTVGVVTAIAVIVLTTPVASITSIIEAITTGTTGTSTRAWNKWSVH